uniref:hypothetical protein n=1 Tax=Prevotella brunnea TaxID=2508867 RepID=UPI001F00E9CF|nr:hypothetical protein [Prevotella brunnea]
MKSTSVYSVSWVRESFVPPELIQQLWQYDFDGEIVRKLSKLDAVVQCCNIRTSNYVSSANSKSYKICHVGLSRKTAVLVTLIKSYFRFYRGKLRKKSLAKHLKFILFIDSQPE